MTDLIDEVKDSFLSSNRAVGDTGPFQIIRPGMELAPGFIAMRAYYQDRLLVITRRGYHHHAGSTMAHDAAELLELTAKKMLSPLVGTIMEAFSDGVMIGQQSDVLIKICCHFHMVETLFDDATFRKLSASMASGFAEDPEVAGYFSEYLGRGLAHLSHVTGFAHHQVDPNKVWDIWMMTGAATTSASYLAGHRMGRSWKERDVLDGIEIATEEGHGPEGEDAEGG